MGYKLTGLPSLSYMGVEASTPPQMTVQPRPPVSTDDKNFNVGTFWLVYNMNLAAPEQLWLLVSLGQQTTPGKALWIELFPGSGGLSLFADDGNFAETNITGDIYLLGDTNTNIATSVPGGSGTSEMRINLNLNPVIDGIQLQDLTPGGPVFATNDGTLETRSGTDGQLILGNSTDPADWGSLTSSGGTVSITYDNITNTLNFDATGVAGLVQLTTDNGIALPSAGNINVKGRVGNSISTDATDAVNTVSIYLNDDVDVVSSLTLGFTTPGILTVNNLGVVSSTGAVATSYAANIGSAVPASNILNVLGDTTSIETTGAGSTITIGVTSSPTIGGIPTFDGLGAGVVQSDAGGLLFSNKGIDGQILISSTAGVPAWSSISAGAGISVTPGSNTITIAASGGGGGASDFVTDTGTATQVGSSLNVFGDNLIETLGSGDTVTVQLTETGTNGQIPISAFGGAPIWANLTAGSGVSIVNAANSITIAASGGGGGGLLVANTDSGAATVNGSNELDIVGGDNINTEGAADVLIINLNESVGLPNTNSSGTTGVIAIGSTSIPTDRFVHNYGTNNTFLGHGAGNLSLTTGSATGNTATGSAAMTSLTTGASNTGYGFGALQNIADGSNNTALGVGAASALTTSDSDNIVIGSAGNAGWNNKLSIGGGTGTGAGQQDEATIYGIYGRPVSGGVQVVLQDSGEVLGTGTAPTDGMLLIGDTGGSVVWSTLTAGSGMTITNAAGSITLASTGGAAGLTVMHTNSGDATVSGANSLTATGTSPINTAGAGETITFSLTNGSNGQVLLGGGSAATWASITAGTGISLTPGANSLTITNTSTGVATVTAGANLNDSGTASDPIINFDKYIHTWGDTTAAGTNGVIYLNTVPFMHAYSSVASQASKNTFLGYAAGNFTSSGASNNVGIGLQALTSLTSGDNNCALGDNAGVLLSNSSGNIILGSDSMDSATSGCDFNVIIGYQAARAITSNADNNIAIGEKSLNFLTTGDSNISIGEGNASNGITTGSNNIVMGNTSYAQTTSNSCIIIGNNQTVLTGNDGAIRIGTAGSNTGSTIIGRALTGACTIGGIYGKSVSAATESLVVNDSTGLLGNLSLSANQVVGKGPTGGLNGLSIVDTSTVTATVTNFTLGFNTLAQAAFLAIQTFNAPNVTGDNSVYTLGTAQSFTEIFDNTGSFFPGNGAGGQALFTAPVTGKYFIEMLIQATNLPVPPPPPAPTPRCPMDILTSNRTYIMEPLFLGSSVSTTQSYAFSVLADFDAGDTCHWTWNLLTSAGTKTVGCGASTFLCGYLAVRA